MMVGKRASSKRKPSRRLSAKANSTRRRPPGNRFYSTSGQSRVATPAKNAVQTSTASMPCRMAVLGMIGTIVFRLPMGRKPLKE